MKMPRNISSEDLAKSLSQFGYSIVRQTGSHIRLVTLQKGEHHVTVPAGKPMRIGTISSILNEVADHFGLSREDLLSRLFGS